MSGPGKILIMAAGTGGHIYPALAVASAWQQQGGEVVWLGTPKGMESRLIPEQQIPLETISISGLRGKGRGALLWAPFRLLRALLQAIQVIHRTKPDVVLGMGGFVAGPGGLAAWLLRKPLVIHEQNAIAGLTNRLLSRIASTVLEAFPGTFSGKGLVQTVGNPIRSELGKVADLQPHQPLRLLVLGGSLGAQRINQLMPAVFKALGEKIALWHQTGGNNFQEAEGYYRQQQISLEQDAVRVVPYIDDMEAAYQWADLVLCRAGAMTVSELALVGRGAILIPFPFAVDDHQTANGQFLVEVGAAQLVQQRELDEARLVELIGALVASPQQVEEMGRRARDLGQPEATRNVVEICQEWSRR